MSDESFLSGLILVPYAYILYMHTHEADAWTIFARRRDRDLDDDRHADDLIVDT